MNLERRIQRIELLTYTYSNQYLEVGHFCSSPQRTHGLQRGRLLLNQLVLLNVLPRQMLDLVVQLGHEVPELDDRVLLVADYLLQVLLGPLHQVDLGLEGGDLVTELLLGVVLELEELLRDLVVALELLALFLHLADSLLEGEDLVGQVLNHLFRSHRRVQLEFESKR